MSRVDVFVPCYKYGHYLRECVTSILTQAGVDVRVLVLDDCSPDNTPEVARQLMSEDPRVEYHRNATNLGHIRTYNLGIEWCKGEYCLLLSADDLLLPGALSRAVNVLDAHPRASFCHGEVEWRAQYVRNSAERKLDGGFSVISGMEYVRGVCARGANAVHTPTAVVRTTVQRAAGGYASHLPHAGDMEMWMRLAMHGDVGHINARQAVYRVHGHNMSQGYYAGCSDMEQYRAVFETFFREFGDRIPEMASLRASAMTATAARAIDKANVLFEQGDMPGCRRLLALIQEVAPHLTRSRDWRRFRMKRLLGRTGTSVVRTVLSVVRGRHDCQVAGR
jgi:glycosyltransferase involved in cell wall biosynthesis